MNRSPARALWCVAALGTLGYGEGERAALWVPSDSAGVEIVTNRSDGASWRLSQVPVLSLGVVDQGGPTEFYRVSDLELLEDGGLAVANTGTEEVRLFASGGQYRGSYGGDGYGPEEFRRLAMLDAQADSLLTYDRPLLQARVVCQLTLSRRLAGRERHLGCDGSLHDRAGRLGSRHRYGPRLTLRPRWAIDRLPGPTSSYSVGSFASRSPRDPSQRLISHAIGKSS